jgi:hypothetical protein
LARLDLESESGFAGCIARIPILISIGLSGVEAYSFLFGEIA